MTLSISGKLTSKMVLVSLIVNWPQGHLPSKDSRRIYSLIISTYYILFLSPFQNQRHWVKSSLSCRLWLSLFSALLFLLNTFVMTMGSPKSLFLSYTQILQQVHGHYLTKTRSVHCIDMNRESCCCYSGLGQVCSMPFHSIDIWSMPGTCAVLEPKVVAWGGMEVAALK